MKLKSQTVKQLKEIVQNDYGTTLTDEQAIDLGTSLLRLTRVAVAALARAGEKYSPVQARECTSLEPKTST